jgi:hypothetical protein
MFTFSHPSPLVIDQADSIDNKSAYILDPWNFLCDSDSCLTLSLICLLLRLIVCPIRASKKTVCFASLAIQFRSYLERAVVPRCFGLKKTTPFCFIIPALSGTFFITLLSEKAGLNFDLSSTPSLAASARSMIVIWNIAWLRSFHSDSYPGWCAFLLRRGI